MNQQTPAQDAGEKVNVPEVEYAPLPRSLYERPSAMWIRVYDVCPDGRRHTDPGLQASGYADSGI